MKKLMILIATIFIFDLSFAQGQGRKITICHIPPGNPSNAHTITISANAWPAHQAHGDQLGACGSVSQNNDDNNNQNDNINHQNDNIHHNPPHNYSYNPPHNYSYNHPSHNNNCCHCSSQNAPHNSHPAPHNIPLIIDAIDLSIHIARLFSRPVIHHIQPHPHLFFRK